jgi:small conductance mechanosensitive channel
VALEAREEFRVRVIVLVNWTIARCLERLEQINLRIAEARSDFEEFDTSPRGAIAQSFIQEQVRLRFDYARAIVDYLNARDRLALDPVLADMLETDTAALRGEAKRRIQLLAEQLVGQIRLDNATLSEFRNRRAEDPLNQDLERAHNALRMKHTRSLSNLTSTIAMLNQLEVDTAEYRALLLQQRGFIGVELLQREVFFSVMREQINRFQNGLVRGGPNFIFRTVIFLAVVGATLLLARWVRRPVRYLVSRECVKLGRLASEVLISISWFVTFLAGLIIALYTLGVSVTPLLAGFGVAGIIIGFAMQDTLSNLASGAAILLYRPYDVDDHIKIAGGEGEVKKMNLVATTIHTFDNQALVVPNNKIWGDTIINFTANRVRRVDIEATFSYS